MTETKPMTRLEELDAKPAEEMTAAEWKEFARLAKEQRARETPEERKAALRRMFESLHKTDVVLADDSRKAIYADDRR